MGFHANFAESFVQLVGLGQLMSKAYAVFSSEHILETTLIDGIHDIPHGAVEITGGQHKEIINETDGVWTLQSDGAITKEPLPDVEPDYPALIASIRYDHEKAGINVNGIRIDTDRESQALITGAAISAMLDSSYVCTWKSADGPVQLTAVQLIGIATAVRTHVQACFDRECELLAAVADATFTETMLADGWPT